MENPSIILWVPIIVISLLSIFKMISKSGNNGKPWIRIEEVKENE
jgi:hypothetical protein